MMYKTWRCPKDGTRPTLYLGVCLCVQDYFNHLNLYFNYLYHYLTHACHYLNHLYHFQLSSPQKKKQDYFNHLYHFRLSAPQGDTDYSLCSDSVNSLSADLRGLLGCVYIYTIVTSIIHCQLRGLLGSDMCVYMCMYVCMIRMYVCMYVSIYKYMYVCIYI